MEQNTQFHTPVPKALVVYCEKKIDALRHAQTVYRPPSDLWWAEVRADLVRHYRMAWTACQGRITSTPLWNRKTGELTPLYIQLDSRRESTDNAGLMVYQKGTIIRLQVDYLEVPPPEWICDL